MTKQDKKEVYKIVAEAIEEVALPSMEKMICSSEKSVKNEIRSEFKLELKLLEKKIDEKMDDKFKKYKNEILDAIDSFAKDVKDKREEQESIGFVLSQLDEKYLDHDKRIVVLEEKMA